MVDDIIRTEGLTKVFPGGRSMGGRPASPEVIAVDDLHLTVGRGEIYGLLGPNGAGKSTTIGMLTTRVTPTSGQAFIGGVDVVAKPAIAKQVIGVVPQTNTLDRALTVAENLEMHGRYFGMRAPEARRISGELLEKVRLADRAAAPVASLSGGMAQRLMVARAIMHRPQMLFLDEPTAGLDPQSRIALWEILQQFHDEGQTILLTTHYMDEADQLCDRVAIMDHGRILALDTPEGLKRSVGIDTIVRVNVEAGDLHVLAARLLEAIPAATSAKAIDGAVQLETHKAPGLLPHIIDASEKAGYQVTDLSMTEPTLETVFISLTGKDLRE
jgi:ABC-2 type transport system ATP-binding protein